jgi:hypothetical protein
MVARRVSAWGHRADGDRLRAWAGLDGAHVMRPEQPNAARLSGHGWLRDPARLDEIIAKTASHDVPTLWISGPAANALRLAGRFDAVFPLEINRFRRQSVGEAAKPCGACSPDRLDRVGCVVALRRRSG